MNKFKVQELGRNNKLKLSECDKSLADVVHLIEKNLPPQLRLVVRGNYHSGHEDYSIYMEVKRTRWFSKPVFTFETAMDHDKRLYSKSFTHKIDDQQYAATFMLLNRMIEDKGFNISNKEWESHQ